MTIDVSEGDLRAIAERGYEGAVSNDHDQQAQAVSLFITDMLAASIGRGNGVAKIAKRRFPGPQSKDTSTLGSDPRWRLHPPIVIKIQTGMGWRPSCRS